MIDPTAKLSVSRQAIVLGISRVRRDKQGEIPRQSG